MVTYMISQYKTSKTVLMKTKLLSFDFTETLKHANKLGRNGLQN